MYIQINQLFLGLPPILPIYNTECFQTARHQSIKATSSNMTEQRVIPCQSYYRIGFLSNTSSSHLHTHKTLNMGYGQSILTQFSIHFHHIIKITQVSDTLGKIISLPMRYTTAYKYMSYTLLYISNNTSQLGVMSIIKSK